MASRQPISVDPIVKRPGQPLVLVMTDTPSATAKHAETLACRDFGMIVVRDQADLHDVSSDVQARISAVMIDPSISVDGCGRLLKSLNLHDRTADIPVVIAAGDAVRAAESILSEICGFRMVPADMSDRALRYVLADAIAECARVRFLRQELLTRTSAIGHICAGTFRIKNRREASNLATMLSLTVDDPAPVAIGLAELLLNAVEHGCLGIGSAEKERLIEEGVFNEELERRMADPAYAGREVELDFKREGAERRFQITDPGKGFDHQPYAHAEAELSFTKSGRGILMARQCFARLDYKGSGNQVVAVYVEKKPGTQG